MGLMDAFLGPGLFIKLGLDKQGFDEGMGKVKVDLTQWRNNTNESTRDMAKWGAAIGATVAPILAVGTAVYALSEKYGGLAQQLRDLNYTTGLSIQKLQQLEWASIMSGTSFDRVTFAVGQMNLKMEEAADHASAAYRAFYELGVNPEGKTPDEVFDAVAQALVKVEDASDRARIANELWGRSWREMLPFIQEYIDKKEEIAKKPTFTEEDLSGFAMMKESWDTLIHTMDIYIGKVIAIEEKYSLDRAFDPQKLPKELLPFMADVADAASRMPPPIDKSAKSMKELADEALKTQRRLEDLAQSIIDTQLSITGTGMDQRDLGSQYNKLKEEQALNDLKISAQPESSEARDLRERNKEIEKELERIAYQMNVNNQSLNKDLTSLQRDQQDLASTAIETDTKILESLQARVETTKVQTDALNQIGLEHWTTEATLAQITYQAIIDYAAEAVNFAGSHPVVQKIVQLSASGYDIDPSPLPVITAPVLKAADFSKVLTKAQPAESPESEGTSGTGGGTGGGNTTTITLNQTNYGVPDNGVATNKMLGLLAQRRGASGL